MVLTCTPIPLARTFKEIVHEAPTARVLPVRLINWPPDVAVTTPRQFVVVAAGLAMTRPDGSVSENATPVSAAGFVPGLVMVKVRLVVSVGVTPNSTIWGAPNAFVMVGGPNTFSVAVEVLPSPAPASVTVTELTWAPGAMPVTFKLTVQEPAAAKVIALADTVPLPAVAVIGPLAQVVANAFGVATTNPAGKESVNETLASA